jgi:hypothetical protein
MSLALVHDFLANSVLIYTIILCLWGFWRVIRKQILNGSYRGALVIAEILILTQGALGGFLWLSSLRPERGGMHVLYGVVGVLGIPAVYLFTKGRGGRLEMILYAAVMLFNSGIFLRAMATGG